MNMILFGPGETGKALARTDERALHLLKVLHKKAGDSFDAGVEGGALGKGVITQIKNDELLFTLTLDAEPPPRTPVRLMVGFPRPIQLRRLLRDLGSLGLQAVDLAGTELGEQSYRDTKLLESGGARRAMIEGSIQARDTRIPLLSQYPDVRSWLAARPWSVPGDTSAVRLIAADNVRPQGFLGAVETPERAVLAIGSERGWSDHERDLFDAAGFARLSMGPRTLRTETACVSAVVLLMRQQWCKQ
ncbi:MAG: 16S rRNA (uracil(1498)-N(3))-methyltransferase [Treponema sp.]|jgi:RsmE family RNA methyltransferase|nr:16S rRNA (uracil(1498)-N(3))-methyltransferase [Treponema sp.]